MGLEKLSSDEINHQLQNLAGWTINEGKLRKEFQFKDFVEVIGFMTRAAIHIEKLNHHPEWFNVYNKLIVDLTTHDVGGITKNDLNLAEILNSLET